MGRKTLKTPNITKDYDNITTATSITLPSAYTEYLKRLLPLSEFSSISEMTKIALSDMFPSPESLDTEEEQLRKIAEAYIAKKPIRKIKFRTETGQMVHKARQKIVKHKTIPTLDEYERSTLSDKWFHVYKEGKRYIFEITNFEDRNGRMLMHDWEIKSFGHNNEFCKSQAQAIWVIHTVDTWDVFDKDEFIETTTDLLLGFSG